MSLSDFTLLPGGKLKDDYERLNDHFAEIKTEVDNKPTDDDITTALISRFVYKGVINCSANPVYPDANAGDWYRVSVAGKIGGVSSGLTVEAGDRVYCFADNTLAGTQASVGLFWDLVKKFSNVDNTTDAGKPVSDLQAAAIAAKKAKYIGQDLDSCIYNKAGLKLFRTDLLTYLAQGTGVLDMPVIGDSITSGWKSMEVSGQGAISVKAQRGFGSYTAQLRKKLNENFASSTIIPQESAGMIYTRTDTEADLWTYTGTWADSTNFGKVGLCKFGSVANSYAEVPFYGTGVNIYFGSTNIYGCLAKTEIDGGSAKTYDVTNCGNCATFTQLNHTGLTLGWHTLKVTVLASAGTGYQQMFLIGAKPTNATSRGFQTHEVSYSAKKAQDFSSSPSFDATFNPFPSVKLTIINLIVNDFYWKTTTGKGSSYANPTAGSYKAHIKTLTVQALAGGGSVLFVVLGRSNPSSPIAHSDYVDVLKEITDANPTKCAIINVWDYLGGSYTAEISPPGYGGTSDLYFYNDDVHPNFRGHGIIADAIYYAMWSKTIGLT